MTNIFLNHISVYGLDWTVYSTCNISGWIIALAGQIHNNVSDRIWIHTLLINIPGTICAMFTARRHIALDIGRLRAYIYVGVSSSLAAKKSQISSSNFLEGISILLSAKISNMIFYFEISLLIIMKHIIFLTDS